MKSILQNYLLVIILGFSCKAFSQTYQLVGNPVNTAGWDVVPNAAVNGDNIRLTENQNSRVGGIKLNDPINLKTCENWRVEFDLLIRGTNLNSRVADGIAFWYLADPPAAYVNGGGLGIPQNAKGLMVAFDVYNNNNDGQMSKVHVLYGTNNGNIEFNNTPGSTFHSPDLRNTPANFNGGANYKHVEVRAEVDPANPANWIIQIRINNTLVVDQSFQPSGGAVNMTQGYFGFSASTGAKRAAQSIKNVRVYADKVQLLQDEIFSDVCIDQATGNGTVDLTSYNNQFVNNPANYNFTYFEQGSGVPIANPTSFQYTADTTVEIFVKDPATTLCAGNALIHLNATPFIANDAVLTECNNNNSGVGTYNLTNANLTPDPGAVTEYYPSLQDLNDGTNQIANPGAYVSPEGVIFAKVTTPLGCSDIAQITLNLFPVVEVNEATLRSCFLETDVTRSLFDLTQAVVTAEAGMVRQYYPSLTDALNDTNEIMTPDAYLSPNGTIYIKVSNAEGCFSVAKVTLVVIPPVYSDVLKDKVICIENTTSLDAGPGFDEYEWSTGEDTQVIQDVGVGTYWVRLRTGECTAIQSVKVYASEQPVVSEIDIKNNTITVNVKGGTPAYQYSLDNINWQDSNVFEGLSRGEHHVFVKDAYDCDPVKVTITVPNIINSITPNGDGVNDGVDYSALAYKKNLSFVVYNRYGNRIYEAGKEQNYKWDGTAFNKKIPTGTYWYVISWNEDDKAGTLTKYSGWILVKNRD